MSVVEKTPPIRFWHARIRWNHFAMLTAVVVWAAFLMGTALLTLPRLMPPAMFESWVSWTLLPAFFVVLAEAGGLWVVGYHRARGPFPQTVWHVSRDAEHRRETGSQFSLDPQRCRLRGRMVRSIRPPRRATYVFDRSPSRSDAATNGVGSGTLYELQVITAPNAHYRRWDGSGALGSLEPIDVRVVSAEDAIAVSRER